MIGRRALVQVPFQGYVPRFVLECAKCYAIVTGLDRDGMVSSACDAGWTPDEETDAFYCPEHVPAEVSL